MRHTTAQISSFMSRLGTPPKGKAAASKLPGEVIGYGRELDGRFYLRREYYLPESYEDDDSSTTGWKLPAQAGATRHAVEVHADGLDELRDRISELG